jgi:hypothetical protein
MMMSDVAVAEDERWRGVEVQGRGEGSGREGGRGLWGRGC